MPISRPLAATITRLPTATIANYKHPVVPDFGMVFDLHQDYPSRTQFFYPPRGYCIPVKVSFDPANLVLVDDKGGTVAIDERAKFMTVQAWATFVMNFIIENGRSPLAPNGVLKTELVRDARQHRNLFRSFRQMVNHAATRGGGTSVRP